MPADIAVIGEFHITPFNAILILQVSGDSEMKAKTTDERAAIAGIDVEAAPRREGLLAVKQAAVSPINIHREHLPSRKGKPVQLFHADERALRRQMNATAAIAVGNARYLRPVAFPGVYLLQDLRKGDDPLPHHPDIHFWQELHDFSGHAGEKASPGNDQGLRGMLLGVANHLLDISIGGSDASRCNHIPARWHRTVPDP